MGARSASPYPPNVQPTLLRSQRRPSRTGMAPPPRAALLTRGRHDSGKASRSANRAGRARDVAPSLKLRSESGMERAKGLEPTMSFCDRLFRQMPGLETVGQGRALRKRCGNRFREGHTASLWGTRRDRQSGSWPAGPRRNGAGDGASSTSVARFRHLGLMTKWEKPGQELPVPKNLANELVRVRPAHAGSILRCCRTPLMIYVEQQCGEREERNMNAPVSNLWGLP
jgi:hypothetical protein